MGKSPGTTLEEPCGPDWKPDLKKSLHDINEYLRDQNAYDLFDSILQELVTRQPKDPVDHMLRFLSKPHSAQGPLTVIVSRPPGSESAGLAKQLAQQFGCEYINAGELLRESAKIDTFTLGGYAESDEKVAELVMDSVKKAQSRMAGVVLEGFPRTRFQTSYLKQHGMVPSHVLVLKSSCQKILERNRQIADGKIEGRAITEDVLQQKLRMHTCHAPSALEAYRERTTIIDTIDVDPKQVWEKMLKAVRMQPRSKAPQLPPRVVVLGPRGAGAREHASRLAARLGAVFVDAAELAAAASADAKVNLNASANMSGSMRSKNSNGSKIQSEKQLSVVVDGRQKLATMELPNAEGLAKQDKLGMVGVRLRQEDCTNLGWVLCNFPNSTEKAEALAADEYLAPTRVVALEASEDTCVSRLRHIYIDSVTGKIWTSQPQNSEIRRRLIRRPEDQPDVVKKMHEEYSSNIHSILETLQARQPGKCIEIPANGSPEAVFNELVEFAERPLPLPEM